MYHRIRIFSSVFIIVFFLLTIFSSIFADSFRGKPILSGTWRNQEIEYVAGETLVKLKPGVSPSQIEQLLDENEGFLIGDFDKYRWGLVGLIPFNPRTIIKYNLPQKTKVTIKIYNILGQLVKTLVDEVQGSGVHQIAWKGENNSGQKVSSGIYFYRIQTEDFVEVKKMIFIK